MGRDDALNVDTAREQIYPRSTQEYIVLPKQHLFQRLRISCYDFMQ